MTDRRRFTIAALAAAACVSVAATAVSAPTPRLVWNASASAPIGLYYTMPGARARVGDLVIARLHHATALLAASRQYLPLGVPLVKRVVAVAGHRICANGDEVAVDGKHLVRRLERDRLGRALPHWSGCRTLRPGEVLLAMVAVPDSFDGRYFGATASGDIIARAEPLWVR